MNTEVYQLRPPTNACVNEARHPALQDHPIEWSARIPDEPTIVRCSYCGSITPQLAMALLKDPGTGFSGSDWKYGWPHKFYLTVPNPDRDKLVPMSWRTGPDVDGTHPEDEWSCHAHNRSDCACPKEPGVTGHWTRVERGHRETLHLKFYSNHLADATDAEFAEYSVISKEVFAVEWERDADLRLKWRAVRGIQLYGDIGADGKPDHSKMQR